MPRDLDKLTREYFLRSQLRATGRDLAAAKKAKAWTAVSTIRKTVLQVRAELDVLLDEKARKEEKPLDPAERYAQLIAIAESWPDRWFEGVMQVYAERHNVVFHTTRKAV